GAGGRDPVRDEVRSRVVVEGRRDFRVTDVPDAGRETRQSERVAVRQRQFRNAPPVNHLPRRGRVGLEQRRGGGAVDRVRHVPDLKLQINLQLVADSDLDLLPGWFLKPPRFDGDVVRTGYQIERRVIAVPVRRG